MKACCPQWSRRHMGHVACREESLLSDGSRIQLLWPAWLKCSINIRWLLFTERSDLCTCRARAWTSTKCDGELPPLPHLPAELSFWHFNTGLVLTSPRVWPSTDRGDSVAGRSHHGRGGHVGVTWLQDVVTGDEGVARRPGRLGRSRPAGRRHGRRGSRGRRRGVCSRLRDLGGRCSPCKNPAALVTLSVFIYSGLVVLNN